MFVLTVELLGDKNGLSILDPESLLTLHIDLEKQMDGVGSVTTVQQLSADGNDYSFSPHDSSAVKPVVFKSWLR